MPGEGSATVPCCIARAVRAAASAAAAATAPAAEPRSEAPLCCDGKAGSKAAREQMQGQGHV